MSYSQEQIGALEDAIATGALTVEMDGKRITYRRLADMQRLLVAMKAEFSGSAANAPRFIRIYHDGKGL